MLQGDYRRSYVLWKENVPPTVLIEYASDHGEKERDPTPREGKFWVYEQAVRGEYYAIFIVATGELEVYRLRKGQYRRLRRNAHRHYPIKPLGVALGVWHGLYGNEMAPWLRWYDNQGNLLPIDVERRSRRRGTTAAPNGWRPSCASWVSIPTRFEPSDSTVIGK